AAVRGGNRVPSQGQGIHTDLAGRWRDRRHHPRCDDGRLDGAPARPRPCLPAGAIVGPILAARMGDGMARRPAYCLLCVFSLASVYLLFLGNRAYGPAMLFWTFVAGTMTASFYGWVAR